MKGNSESVDSSGMKSIYLQRKLKVLKYFSFVSNLEAISKFLAALFLPRPPCINRFCYFLTNWVRNETEKLINNGKIFGLITVFFSVPT